MGSGRTTLMNCGRGAKPSAWMILDKMKLRQAWIGLMWDMAFRELALA
jgi:hypothetical protein